MRAQNSPLGLYLKREWPGTVGRSWAQRLVAVGKSWKSVVGRWGRPTQGFGQRPYGPSGWQPAPRCYLMVINFEHLGARPNFASKDFQKYISKDFNAQKIFLDFYKNRKVARKDSRMQWCFEISNMQWKKFQKSRKANLVEN